MGTPSQKKRVHSRAAETSSWTTSSGSWASARARLSGPPPDQRPPYASRSAKSLLHNGETKGYHPVRMCSRWWCSQVS
ncbi:hypothetical protein ACFRAR_38530 [Kitasatospora sp. NPDC056651]|uniref:hypothetical protein n=1 Tax=Kitasatospora sp. NPDC056651 TaxID=3345892 RepID=UPI0036CED0C4